MSCLCQPTGARSFGLLREEHSLRVSWRAASASHVSPFTSTQLLVNPKAKTRPASYQLERPLLNPPPKPPPPPKKKKKKKKNIYIYIYNIKKIYINKNTGSRILTSTPEPNQRIIFPQSSPSSSGSGGRLLGGWKSSFLAVDFKKPQLFFIIRTPN